MRGLGLLVVTILALPGVEFPIPDVRCLSWDRERASDFDRERIAEHRRLGTPRVSGPGSSSHDDDVTRIHFSYQDPRFDWDVWHAIVRERYLVEHYGSYTGSNGDEYRCYTGEGRDYGVIVERDAKGGGVWRIHVCEGNWLRGTIYREAFAAARAASITP